MDDVNIEFCAEYHHDGATWGLNFFAKDLDDARAKIESLKASIHLLGKLALSAPVADDTTASSVVVSSALH